MRNMIHVDVSKYQGFAPKLEDNETARTRVGKPKMYTPNKLRFRIFYLWYVMVLLQNVLDKISRNDDILTPYILQYIMIRMKIL